MRLQSSYVAKNRVSAEKIADSLLFWASTPQSMPFSANENLPSVDRMIWSSKVMWTLLEESIRLFVIFTSSEEGNGEPLVWKWTRT